MSLSPFVAILISAILGVAVGATLVATNSLLTRGAAIQSTQLKWDYGCSGCTFDDGIRNAATIVPPVIPNNTTSAYLQITLSVHSWTQWNGTGNSTGSCDSETSACKAFVGIWSPTAWDTYAVGGVASPFWCFTAGGPACTNTSTLSVSSPSLLPLIGEPFEVVIWNIAPFGLIGDFSVVLYATPYFSPIG